MQPAEVLQGAHTLRDCAGDMKWQRHPTEDMEKALKPSLEKKHKYLVVPQQNTRHWNCPNHNGKPFIQQCQVHVYAFLYSQSVRKIRPKTRKIRQSGKLMTPRLWHLSVTLNSASSPISCGHQRTCRNILSTSSESEASKHSEFSGTLEVVAVIIVTQAHT